MAQGNDPFWEAGLETSISSRTADSKPWVHKGASVKELLHKHRYVKPERDAELQSALGVRWCHSLETTGSTQCWAWVSPWNQTDSANHFTEIAQDTDTAPVSLSSQLLRRGQSSSTFCFKEFGGVLLLGRAQAARWAVPWEDLCLRGWWQVNNSRELHLGAEMEQQYHLTKCWNTTTHPLIVSS